MVHLGDVGTEAVLDELVGTTAHVVFGNCDFDVDRLARHAEAMEIGVAHPMGVLHDGTRRVAFTHGHLEGLMEQAVAEGVEYLLHGHTHEVRDERVGGTRIVNPGALFRAARYTAAVLDTSADEVEFVEIAKT